MGSVKKSGDREGRKPERKNQRWSHDVGGARKGLDVSHERVELPGRLGMELKTHLTCKGLGEGQGWGQRFTCQPPK